jgi:hypothetical protein
VRLRVVLAVALALVGAGLVLALSQRGARMAGTSFVPVRTFAVTVPPGERACQPATYLAGDSDAAVLLAAAYGRPLPAVSVTFADADGRLVARGGAPGRASEGDVAVPFERVVEHERYGLTACVRNRGDVRLALGGDVASPAAAARIGDEVTQGVVAFRYLRPGRESWWAIAGTVTRRFGLGKSALLGSWTLPLLVFALAGAWFAAIRLLLREAP